VSPPSFRLHRITRAALADWAEQAMRDEEFDDRDLDTIRDITSRLGLADVLNPSHKRGGAKARLLLSLGYRTDAPDALESDLRAQHLSLNATRTAQNPYGVAYEIEGPITTPSGRIVRFCSIWQIDTGSEVPRFITMYPR
jgi:hypothetical protein